MAVQHTDNSAAEFVSAGLPGLDSILGGLRSGDNVVWRIDSVEDYRAFVAPFGAVALAAGLRVVYIRFTFHPPVMETDQISAIYNLDAYRGFESFTVHLHTIIGPEGEGIFHVFGCLFDLLDAWATDGMVGNFFRVTCPYLVVGLGTRAVDRVEGDYQLRADIMNQQVVCSRTAEPKSRQ